MSIHKTDRSRFSSDIFNEGAYDHNLSWQAKGLLWFLLTNPNHTEFYEASECNSSSVDSTLQELQVKGYLFALYSASTGSDFEVFESKRDAREWLIGASQSVVDSIVPTSDDDDFF